MSYILNPCCSAFVANMLTGVPIIANIFLTWQVVESTKAEGLSERKEFKEVVAEAAEAAPTAI